MSLCCGLVSVCHDYGLHTVRCQLDARVVGLLLDILCQLCKCFLLMIGLCQAVTSLLSFGSETLCS